MINRLRAATSEEIEKFKETSDIDPSCLVVALDMKNATAYAVIRTAIEVDPVLFPPEWNTKMKAIFVRDIETHLTAKGAISYYFQVLCSDEEWQENIKHWGCEQLSVAPEFRFKRKLF